MNFEHFESALELHYMNKELERYKDDILEWIKEEKGLNPGILNSQFLKLPGLVVRENNRRLE